MFKPGLIIWTDILSCIFSCFLLIVIETSAYAYMYMSKQD